MTINAIAIMIIASSGVISVKNSSKYSKKRLKIGIFFFMDVILPQKSRKSRKLSSSLDFFQSFRFTFTDLRHHSQCTLLNCASSLIYHLLYLLSCRGRQLFPVRTHGKSLHHLFSCRSSCFCIEFCFCFSSHFLSLTSCRTQFSSSSRNHRTLGSLLWSKCF